MSIFKTLRVIVLLTALFSTACGGRTPSKTNTTNNAPRATPQIVTGFQALPQMTAPTLTATATNAPTATPIFRTAMVTPTVLVPVTVTPLPPTPTLLPTWTATPPIPLFTPTETTNLPLGLNCDDPNAQITWPRMGETIRWGTTMPMTGTANISNFLYWKIQYEPAATYRDPAQRDYGWGELYRSEKDPRKLATGSPQPVVNGKLMAWDTKTVPPAVYWLRLIVHRHDGNYPEPCVVKIAVER